MKNNKKTNRLKKLLVPVIITATIIVAVLSQKNHPAIFSPDMPIVTDIILGRPTDTTITANIIVPQNLDVYLEYGTSSKIYTQKTPISNLIANQPTNITIENLQPDTQYYYQPVYTQSTENTFLNTEEYTFHTQRAPGSDFTFAVQSDPHMDERSSPEVYTNTLTNILADKPDFMLDLGDISVTNQLPGVSETAVQKRYLLMRDYYRLITHSVPLFIALGNHDGETGWNFAAQDNLRAILSFQNRLKYFPNPAPNTFYSGNLLKENNSYPENYYSFTWGDALFVILDPFRYTSTNDGGWAWTLGLTQYEWLTDTLQNSEAKHKFIFLHHLAGGTNYGRGGVEWAQYFEWGGNNSDGSYGFFANRPGWNKPIHQLLVDNQVDIVFKGHDHFFAKQELDGVVYQTLPQPSHAGEELTTPKEYGYVSGDILGGSGYIRVKVSSSNSTVDFIKPDGSIAYGYSI